MVATKIVVYGLSTEGYSIACQMAMKGADVFIVDESAHMAISLKAEIAKTYPNVTSLKEDEPLLGVEPIDVAISHAEYLFFAPRIRKTGQEAKMEIHSKFKDATSSIKKGGSVIYNLPTGIGGNNETISLLEHVSGLEMGKNISYFYYPLSKNNTPEIIGSFNAKNDDKLSKLLESDKKNKKFVSIPSSEILHATKILTQFASLSSVLEVSKFAQDSQTRNDLVLTEYNDLFLDDMTNGLYDLRSLGTSVEGAGTMMYLVNGSIKGIEGYVKRLIDEIRSTLKKNELKASRTKVVLVWTQDSYEMRGDKVDMLNSLVTKLRDYIGDVEIHQGQELDIFHSDKTTIIVACSKFDYEKITKNGKDSDVIVIKTNPLCEIL
ncbi:MAG: hypothetical protein KGI02_07515 [Thaumarchaeota archaeon]|nr:hypothetical protein [Nitrososphaerota archaeon]MDE1832201.1 hypothetical protein [Nitrososphaerota archaeon]MDE1841932.1 hypothetical protein [Nitrososphaerota archaeon]MDE1878295.1 hypothetical protein [Nitrososphaerota archaeon]